MADFLSVFDTGVLREKKKEETQIFQLGVVHENLLPVQMMMCCGDSQHISALNSWFLLSVIDHCLTGNGILRYNQFIRRDILTFYTQNSSSVPANLRVNE